MECPAFGESLFPSIYRFIVTVPFSQGLPLGVYKTETAKFLNSGYRNGSHPRFPGGFFMQFLVTGGILTGRLAKI